LSPIHGERDILYACAYVRAALLVSQWTICQTVELDASENDSENKRECTGTVQKCQTLRKKGDLGIKNQESKTFDPLRWDRQVIPKRQ